MTNKPKSPKFVLLYGVECRNVRIVKTDKYGVWLEYQVKYARKLQKAWIDFAMLFNSPVLADLYREHKNSV